MSKADLIQEGEYVQAGQPDDPDLNQAFWDFREAIEREANAGGTIAVYECPVDHMGNVRPATYQRAKLFTCPVGQVTIDDICDRVLRDFVEPGGKIVIQLLARKDGERGIKMNKYISLRKGKAGSDGGVPSELAQILRVMSEQNSRTLAAIQAMAENRANAQPMGDPMEKALMIADRIASLTNKVQGSGGGMMGGGDSNNPINQMMTMMLTRMMKDFFDKKDAPPPDTGASTILENIRALAAPLLTAKATQEERALIAEKRMLMHERQATPAPAPAAPGHTEKTESQPAAAAPNAEKDEAKMKLLAVLKEGLPMIVSLAKGPKPADPAETAKLVLKNLPEDEQALNDAFYALVQDPPTEFLGQLAVVCPEVREHAEWFEAFRQALLVEFDPDKLTPA